MNALIRTICRSSGSLHSYGMDILNHPSITYKFLIDLNVPFHKTDTGYSRAVIFDDERLELVKITWDKYAYTFPHTHSMCGCMFRVMDGPLYEHIFENNDISRVNILNKGCISYIGASSLEHSVHTGDNYGLSLHLYPKKKIIEQNDNLHVYPKKNIPHGL